MFSREESAKIRQEFWTSFGKSFPRKWLLYNTSIKGVSLKFYADRKKAGIALDVENSDETFNALLFDQLLSLQTILTTEYLPSVQFDHQYELNNGKIIRRLYLSYPEEFSIHNKNTWRGCYEFFVDKMNLLEDFFLTYQDYIKQSVT